MARKRILAVVNDLALFRKLEDLLRRASFEVNRVPSGAGALVLIGNVKYNLILAGLPLPDLGLQEFLSSLRALDSEGVGSPLVVLAPEADVPALAKALDGELLRVVSETGSDSEIQRAVSEVLGVAARTSTRLLVDMEVAVGGAAQRRLVQTQNLSESGMLLRAAESPEVGARVQLTFRLPDDSKPLTVEGEVVREAIPGKEKLRGFAVRYTKIRSEDLERIQDFVNVDLQEQHRTSAAGAAG